LARDALADDLSGFDCNTSRATLAKILGSPKAGRSSRILTRSSGHSFARCGRTLACAGCRSAAHFVRYNFSVSVLARTCTCDSASLATSHTPRKLPHSRERVLLINSARSLGFPQGAPRPPPGACPCSWLSRGRREPALGCGLFPAWRPRPGSKSRPLGRCRLNRDTAR
jgi:hypothetical protein